MIFETYKAQKEIEKLASIVIRGLASKTYNCHERVAWKEPEEGEYHKMVNKYYRVKFKKPMSGFVDGANYLVNYCDGSKISFQGYNRELNLDDVELTWSEINKYRYKLFVATTVKDAVGDKINKFDELKEFIENTNVRYELKESLNDGIKGNLTHSKYKNDMTITVYYRKNMLTELSETRKKRLEIGGEHNSDDIYFEIFNDLYSTTIHELQHAYDKYRSGGKSFKKQTSDYENRRFKANELKKKAELEEEEKEFIDTLNKEYLNFPHEINARFTQAIQNTSFSELVKNDEGNYRFEMLPLDDVLKSFKLHFKGYNFLDEKSKRKLIRKASQFWHLDKERIEQRNINKRKTKTNESAMHMAYHVTSKHNLDSIMKNGLDARVPEDYGMNGDNKGVYLFKTIDDAKTALGQWLGWRIDDWEEETGKQYDEVLLHVNITGLKCIDTVEFEWTCLEDIPADRIMSVDYES